MRIGPLFKMDGTHRLVADELHAEALIALAYDLNPRTISGGPAWMDVQHFDIEAVRRERCGHAAGADAMLRALLVERFELRFHRERRSSRSMSCGGEGRAEAEGEQLGGCRRS